MLVVDIHKRYSTHLAVDFDPLKPDFERDVNERHHTSQCRARSSSKLILNCGGSDGNNGHYACKNDSHSFHY